VAGAYCERSPVVVLTSTPSAAEAKLGRILHHSLNHGEEHGGIDVFARLHASITAAAARLTPDNARTETERVLSELFRTSCPVYISVPADVQTKPIRDTGPPSNLVAVKTPPSDPAALAACLQAVAAAVNAAQRPCILASSGVLRASCVAELAQLVTTANLPAAVLVMGRGCLDESDPHVVGVYQGASPERGEIITTPVTQRPLPPGHYSCPSAVQGLVESSDCVLSIGANLTDWTTGSFTGHVDDQNIVDVKITRTIVKGAETFHNVRSRDLLAALASAIRPRRAGEDAYWARRTEGDGILRSPAAGPGAPLTTDAILAALQSELRSGDVICFDTCTAGFGLASARLPKGVTVLNQMIYGSIGFATPAASGVAFALEGQPGRRTILVTGDGSLQMTATHIGTMLQARQPVLIVVINSAYRRAAGIGLLSHAQDRRGLSHREAAEPPPPSVLQRHRAVALHAAAERVRSRARQLLLALRRLERRARARAQGCSGGAGARQARAAGVHHARAGRAVRICALHPVQVR